MKRWHRPAIYDIWCVPFYMLQAFARLMTGAEWRVQHGEGFDGQETGNLGSAAGVLEIAHQPIYQGGGLSGEEA